MSMPLDVNCTMADLRFSDGDAVGFLQVCQFVPEKGGYEWVLVCSEDDTQYGDTNNGAIHAACRQLGYVNASWNNTIQ